jgi:hypothetical protein
VFGGVLATPISLPAELSMGVLATIYIPTLVLFVRAARAARHFEPSSTDTMPVAMARLAAADLARRNALDDLRRRAIAIDGAMDDADAERALRLAYALLNSALPSTS